MGDADHDRAEDDRGDQHLDELDERVGQRLEAAPNVGQSQPTAMPVTIATRSWTNSDEHQRLRGTSSIRTSVIRNT